MREVRSRFVYAVVADLSPHDRRRFGRLFARFDGGVAQWTPVRQETA
jgi:hypothetical protein